MKLLQNLILRFKQGLYLRKEYVKIAGLPFSFAQISDLHFDETGKFPEWVQKAVLNYLHINPTEVLAVTGDLIDGTRKEDAERAADYLTKLPVNYVVASLGNHDEKYIDDFYAALRNHSRFMKVKILVNNCFKHKGINFIGQADLHSKYYGKSDISSIMEEDYYHVLLTHNPESFKDVLNLNIPLVISGHTHGGQVFQADLLRKVFKRFINEGKIMNRLRINHEHDCFKLQSSYALGMSILHINNGLGSHPPGRLFCPPTITIYHG